MKTRGDAVDWEAKRQLRLAGGALAIASFLTAASDSTLRIADWTGVLLLTGAIALGPLFGWWTAFSGNQLESALGFLLWMSLFPAVPLALWSRRFNPALLGLATIFWFLSGFYCAVGMWI